MLLGLLQKLQIKKHDLTIVELDSNQRESISISFFPM